MTAAADPAVDPGRPLLIFDGDCGICTTLAGVARRRLGLEHVEPWQFLDLESIGVTEEQCRAAVQWVGTDGAVSSAEDAVTAALRHAGGVWRLPGRFLTLPGVHHLAGVAYRWIARNRSRLPGGTPACQLPPGD